MRYARCTQAILYAFESNPTVSMELDEKTFRKLFPHLAEEVLSGKTKKVRITSVRWDAEAGEKAVSGENLTGYMPDAVDFIRRCRTVEEAEEIIEYLKRRGEISEEYAERLRKQLKTRGLRSFGSWKEPGYYLRKYLR